MFLLIVWEDLISQWWVPKMTQKFVLFYGILLHSFSPWEPMRQFFVNTRDRYPVKTPKTAKEHYMTNRNPSLRDQHELSECLVQDWVVQTIPRSLDAFF